MRQYENGKRIFILLIVFALTILIYEIFAIFTMNINPLIKLIPFFIMGIFLLIPHKKRK